jgi:hypothetical protein
MKMMGRSFSWMTIRFPSQGLHLREVSDEHANLPQTNQWAAHLRATPEPTESSKQLPRYVEEIKVGTVVDSSSMVSKHHQPRFWDAMVEQISHPASLRLSICPRPERGSA